MLQQMAEQHHWSHNEMLEMSKRMFFRYYGYWLINQITQQEEQEREQNRRERNSRKNENRNWKSL